MSLAICQCIINGQSCHSSVSVEIGTDHRFCPNHQNCNQILPLSLQLPEIILPQDLQKLAQQATLSQIVKSNAPADANFSPIVKEDAPKVPQYPASDFQLLRRLGAGTFGEVFRAQYQPTGQSLVLKRIPKSKMSLEQVHNEVLALKTLHPSCAQYILCYENFYQDSKYWYISTENLHDYVALEDLLHNFNDIFPHQATRIIINLISGLETIHKHGMAHRDIKPGNIMIYRKGAAIKFIDFGLSCVEANCTTNSIRGSPSYMAPELVEAVFHPRSFELIDLQKADIWALGMTIYELMTGVLPFNLWMYNLPHKFLKFFKTESHLRIYMMLAYFHETQYKPKKPLDFSYGNSRSLYSCRGII